MGTMALHSSPLEGFGSLLPLNEPFETLANDVAAEMGHSLTPVRQGPAGATPQLAALERAWHTAVALLGQDRGRIAQLCSHFDASLVGSLATAQQFKVAAPLSDHTRKLATLMLIDRLLQEHAAHGPDAVRPQLHSLRLKLETSQISVGDVLDAMAPMVGASRILDLAAPIIAGMGSPQVSHAPQQVELSHSGDRLPGTNPFATFSNASYPLAGPPFLPGAWMPHGHTYNKSSKPTSPSGGGDATVSVAISAADRAAFKGHDATVTIKQVVEPPGLTMRLSSTAPTTAAPKQPAAPAPANNSPPALELPGANAQDVKQRPAAAFTPDAGHLLPVAVSRPVDAAAAAADPDSTPPNSTASLYMGHHSPQPIPPPAVPVAPPPEVVAMVEPEVTPTDSVMSRRVRQPSPLRPRSETTSGVKMCSNPNCRTDRTPLWRRESDMTMCNACGLFYKARGYHRPRELVLQSQQSNRGSYGSGSVGTVKSGMTTPAGGGTPAVSGELHIATSAAAGGSINQLNAGDTATSPPHQSRYRRNPSPLQFQGVDSLGTSGELRKRPSLPGDLSDEGVGSEGMTDGQYSSGGLAFRKSSRQVKKRRESAYEWFDGVEGGELPGGVMPANSDQYSMGMPSNSAGQQRVMQLQGAKTSSRSKGSGRKPLREVSSGAVHSDPSKEFSFGHAARIDVLDPTTTMHGRQHSLYGPACSTPRLPSGPIAPAFGADTTTAGAAASSQQAGGGDAPQTSGLVSTLGDGGAGGAATGEAGLEGSSVPDEEQAGHKRLSIGDLTVETDVMHVAVVLLTLRQAEWELSHASHHLADGSPQDHLMHHHEYEDAAGMDMMGADGAVDISMVHPGSKRVRGGYGGDMGLPAKQPSYGRRAPAGPRGAAARRSPGTGGGAGKATSWSRSKSPGSGSLNARPNVMCTNCTTTKTCLWRKDKETGAPLCNACGIYKNQNGVHRPVPGGHALIQQQQQQALSGGVSASLTDPLMPGDASQVSHIQLQPGVASTLSGCASPSVTVATGAEAAGVPQLSHHGLATPGTASTLSGGGASPAMTMDTATARPSPRTQRPGGMLPGGAPGAASPTVTMGSLQPKLSMTDGSPAGYHQPQLGKGLPVQGMPHRPGGALRQLPPGLPASGQLQHQRQQLPPSFKGPAGAGRPPLAPVVSAQTRLMGSGHPGSVAGGDVGGSGEPAPAAGIPLGMPPVQGSAAGQPPGGIFPLGMPSHVMGATMFPYYYPGAAGPMATAFNQHMMEYVSQSASGVPPAATQQTDAGNNSGMAQGVPAVGTPATAPAPVSAPTQPPATAAGGSGGHASTAPAAAGPAAAAPGVDREKAGQQVLAGCIQLCQVLKEKEDRQRQGVTLPVQQQPHHAASTAPPSPVTGTPAGLPQPQQHQPPATSSAQPEQQATLHHPSPALTMLSGHPASAYFPSVFTPAAAAAQAAGGAPHSSAPSLGQHAAGIPGYHPHLSLMPMAPFAMSGSMFMMGQPSGGAAGLGGSAAGHVGAVSPWLFRPPPPQMQPPAQQL